MFKGKFLLHVSPGGLLLLPTVIRKGLHKHFGHYPELLCFGAQFLYLCHADDAVSLLHRIDEQLCAVAGKARAVPYFKQMQACVAMVQPDARGQFYLPERQRLLLGVPKGGTLTLLGIDDHLEVWNRARLRQQIRRLTKATTNPQDLCELPICVDPSETPCSLRSEHLPSTARCGPCMYLRLP